MRRTLGPLLLLAAALLDSCAPPSPVSSPRPAPPVPQRVDPLAAVPRTVGALAAEGSDEHYDRRTIYGYLDGGAEPYLAYGMQLCASRRYRASGGTVVLDVFVTSAPSDAFGLATSDPDGESVDVGNDGRLRPSWLSFWTGKHYVSITAWDGGANTRDELIALGRVVADRLAAAGEPPPLLSLLPADGLVPRSVRFLHDPVVLSSHVDLGGENPLALSPSTDVVLGRYARGPSRGQLVVVDYPSEALALRAESSARTAGLVGNPESHPVARADGSFSGAVRRDRRLAVVVRANDRAFALALLADAATALERYVPERRHE